jgi:hypothetical protein
VTTDAQDPDTDDADPGAGDPYYMYKPALMGSPWEFVLRPRGLEWRFGRHSGIVHYDRMRHVRMSYRPATMQSHRFLTEIWSANNPKMRIASTSWRGLVELERLDAGYTNFISELHRRLVAANSNAQFTTGMPILLYGLGAAVFAGLMLAMIVLEARALLASDWAGAALVGGFILVFGWQIGNFFRRNCPQRYRPDALPAAVLPRIRT